MRDVLRAEPHFWITSYQNAVFPARAGMNRLRRTRTDCSYVARYVFPARAGMNRLLRA